MKRQRPRKTSTWRTKLTDWHYPVLRFTLNVSNQDKIALMKEETHWLMEQIWNSSVPIYTDSDIGILKP